MESFTQYLWNIPIWIASGIFGCLSRVAIDKSIEYFRIDIVFLDWNGYFVALKWVQFFASVSCIIGIGFWAGIFSIWDKFPINGWERKVSLKLYKGEDIGWKVKSFSTVFENNLKNCKETVLKNE